MTRHTIQYMGVEVGVQELFTLDVLKQYLNAHGATGKTMFELNNAFEAMFHCKPFIVRYPFGTCGYEGAFCVPVQEGIAFLRYQYTGTDGEQLCLDASEMLSHDDIHIYRESVEAHTNFLLSAFTDMEYELTGTPAPDGGSTWGEGGDF